MHFIGLDVHRQSVVYCVQLVRLLLAVDDRQDGCQPPASLEKLEKAGGEDAEVYAGARRKIGEVAGVVGVR